MKTEQEIWNECLGLIKKNTAEQAFETWFEGISLINIANNQATLQVPNRFHYEWIESKYGELIEGCLKKSAGKKLTINYSIVLNNEEENITSNIKKIDELIPASFHRASQLNNRYVFKNFIEGKGNQFAKAAATSVADGPGQTPFNPLLIYSKPGLGKTHLIQAIGNHILQAHPKLKIMYITSEKFMLDFIQSIQNNKSTQFAQSYRKVDVLLVDDVQFFQTKEQTQEQFFHLFNDLFQQGKQIILTTDRHPNELVNLKDRLVSRFQSGLIVDIQPPDFETRIAILMRKAENEKLDIPFEIIEFIAGAIKDDIRIMEGALVKMLALSSLKQADITISLAKEVITNLLGEIAFEQISLEQVCKLVAGHFGLSEKKLYGKSRTADIVSARHVAMYLCRELTNSPLMLIGKHFGKRDHSTVIHACKVVEEKISSETTMKKNINLLKKQLQ
jgi:chromosomal replication initiator protein